VSTDYAVAYESARARLLRTLSDLDWHPWHELKDVAGVCYCRRMLDLKRMGYLIEQRPTPSDGNSYRLMSLTPGSPKPKMVKVYLEEEDVQALCDGTITADARDRLDKALSTFQANRDKL
jgi:hypothetical protein